MSDETASREVTNEELARAAEEVETTETEEVVEEVEEETEETGEEVEETEEEVTSAPPEPTDNRERSALGRRTSYVEERVDTLDSKLDEILAAIELGKKPETPEDEDSFITKGDLKSYMEKNDGDKVEVKARYDKDYIRAISKLGAGEDSDEVFDAILTELNTTYNQTYSKDASQDALINYFKASRAIYGKTEVKKNPLIKNKKKTGGGLSVGGDTTIKPKEAPLPELDEYARDFAKATGMSDEDIRKALASEPIKVVGDTVIGGTNRG